MRTHKQRGRGRLLNKRKQCTTSAGGPCGSRAAVLSRRARVRDPHASASTVDPCSRKATRHQCVQAGDSWSHGCRWLIASRVSIRAAVLEPALKGGWADAVWLRRSMTPLRPFHRSQAGSYVCPSLSWRTVSSSTWPFVASGVALLRAKAGLTQPSDEGKRGAPDRRQKEQEQRQQRELTRMHGISRLPSPLLDLSVSSPLLRRAGVGETHREADRARW